MNKHSLILVMQHPSLVHLTQQTKAAIDQLAQNKLSLILTVQTILLKFSI